MSTPMYEIPDVPDDCWFSFSFKGHTYRLPLLQYLTIDQIRAASAITDSPNGVDVNNVLNFIEALDPDVANIIGALTAPQLLGLFQALQEASTTTVGESAPSTGN